MPCYDSRDSETQTKIYIEESPAQKKLIETLQNKISKMKKKEHKKEVEVCKIMSAVVSLLSEFGGDVHARFSELEAEQNVKQGLIQYHREHRKEDQKYYIKKLKKLLKETEDKKTRKKIKKEIKKAKSYNVDEDISVLRDRAIFSSKFLKASE